MADRPHHPRLSALEPAAQSRIIERAHIIRDWLRHIAADGMAAPDDILPAPAHIQAVLTRLEHDATARQHLGALADALGLSALAVQIALRQCHQHGCFDRSKPQPARIDQHQPQDIHPIQPAFRPLRSQLRALLRRIPDRQERIIALVRGGFCRNRGNAQSVASLVARSEHNSDHAQVKAARRVGHLAPQVDGVRALPVIQTVFAQVTEPEERVRALVQTGVCGTPDQAWALVHRFAQRDRHPSRYDHVLHTCWRRGLFNHLPVRPEVEAIFPRVAALFAAVTDQDDRVHLLCWAGICPDEPRARQVVAAHAPCASPSEQAVVEQCWHAGLFDRASPAAPAHQPGPSQPYAIRPPMHEVEAHLPRVLSSGTPRDTRTQALLAIGCCRDEAAAHRVVADLDGHTPASAVNRIAAALARRILASYAHYGLVGLLDVSDDAPADLLFFVQRAVPYIHETSDTPAATLAVLQRDLVALFRAFEHVESTLWTRDLLDAPIVSTNRTFAQQRISPAQRTAIIAVLQAQYAYPDTEAITLYDLLVERGGSGVIDWRCGIALEDAGHARERRRLRRLLDHHLGALLPQARERIETDVQHLKAAMQASGVTVSLVRLLNSQPSSAFRKRLNHRLPLGYGQVQFFRRKEHRQQRRQHAYRSRTRNPRQPAPDDPLATASALVAQLAARTGLTDREAARRLAEVRTYGGIGFLPKEQWLTLLDARLLALLAFYKFVRIPGRLHSPQILHHVNHYAEQLGLRPVSPQLARAVYGVLRKPGRWNGGESERMATVRTNAGTVLPGMPWLHRVWRLFSLPLNLPIAASSFSGASETSYLLLVVDLGSQLPTGLWVSAHPPQCIEVGLALFQAIWHPGALDWPLRGAPEVLQVPASLLPDGQEVLGPAAAWLRMQVQVVADATQATALRKLPHLQALLDDLAFVGLDEIRRRHASQALPVKAVQDAVLGWIRTSEQGFAHHTPGLPDSNSQKHGYATPAFDTPVAGLLLPVMGDATTVRDGVVVQEQRYTSPFFRSEPGHPVAYRAFPYRYGGLHSGEGMQEALYVADDTGVVQYVTRQW